MPDFLIELLSEEIPARMQAKARADLARLFADQLSAAGLYSQGIDTYATPRRLALIARGLPAETAAVSEEIKGPRTSAPPQALEGFLRKTGLTRDQLTERDGVFFAAIDKPGRATASVLAEAIPAIVRAFPWPKSMRWGSGDSRWVRPLQGIVALLGEDIVECEAAGIASGAATVGHRFHHPGIITIGGAHDYVEKLRACHVILDPAERRAIIAEGAAKAAAETGLTLVEDDGLLDENAGLTEWPVPLLGRFEPAFLDVPREVIQLTMRTNQKYFACTDGEGRLAPNFVCVANIEAADGGAAIVQGNERVLSARLADARYFWEHDLNVTLEEQAKKLSQIVFHEKLGTVADKVERVAKLARWLVEEGIVKSSPERGGGPAKPVEGAPRPPVRSEDPLHQPAAGPPPRVGEDQGLATLAETAARLCKADLVTQMVGEFPELQGVIGGHLARAQGLPDAVADAIRDHYKPVGQGDEVPTAPVTVAVSLADKLDTIHSFFAVSQFPSGSRDPFALRRTGLAIISLVVKNSLRLSISLPMTDLLQDVLYGDVYHHLLQISGAESMANILVSDPNYRIEQRSGDSVLYVGEDYFGPIPQSTVHALETWRDFIDGPSTIWDAPSAVAAFLVDRLKVQQREAGVRHDLIDAVFALGGEDDLVRLLARVKALQAFVETPEGADLLAGYKRAANILKRENWPSPVTPAEAGVQADAAEGADAAWMPASAGMTVENKPLSYTPESEEAALIAALDAAEPKAAAAVEAEDFEGAMAALASLRAPVDAFFDKVTVNDPNEEKRTARLDLLLRMRNAVHQVADFSKIEG